MSPYKTADDLASSLQFEGVDCEVIEDGFIKVPILEPDHIATVRVEGGWAVFKMFIGEWGDGLNEATMRTLLLMNERLLGFRFAADGGEIWVQEEFPVELLNDDFHVYVHHAIDVLSTIIPSLLPFFDSHTLMSEDDIDAVFGRIGATGAH